MAVAIIVETPLTVPPPPVGVFGAVGRALAEGDPDPPGEYEKPGTDGRVLPEASAVAGPVSEEDPLRATLALLATEDDATAEPLNKELAAGEGVG